MFKHALSTSSRALRSSTRISTQTSILRRAQVAPAPLGASQTSIFRSQLSPVPSGSAARAPRARWYSDQAEPAAKEAKEEQKDKESAQDAEAKEAEEPAGEEVELKAKLEAKEKEVRQWKDECLRSVADFRNLQERTQREMKAAREFAIQKFAKDLVDDVDNLDRALTMGKEKLDVLKEGKMTIEDLASFYEGVKMTEKNMLATLKKHGLERFNPEGEKFNPNEHEATFMTPMPGKEEGTVFHVQQKGFKLNSRVLRPAKVGVVKAAE